MQRDAAGDGAGRRLNVHALYLGFYKFSKKLNGKIASTPLPCSRT